jgi:meso-butanediol dehydrogenase / (S,S)-butanediol dehydrogenase / diacetyl reductase
MGDLLRGRVIFLTGGAAGIGRECARVYAAEGAHVVVADVNEQTAEQTVASLSTDGLAVRCDVAEPGDVKEAVRRALARFDTLHAVHNNAGIAVPSKPLHETTDEEWDRLFRVNVRSVHLTTRYAFDALRASKGCIVNTASLVGTIGQTNHAAYVATKGAMIALTRAMALDYAEYGIRVNAVCPAGVWTDMLRQWAAEQPDPHAIAAGLDDLHPLGYCPEGDVVADACAFLLSDRARFITGCALPVGGGAELGYRRTG